MKESLAPPFHKNRCRHSHPPVRRCKDLGSLPEADQATRAVSSTLLVLHPWHQIARLCVKRKSHQKGQPAHIASCAAGHVSGMEDSRMPKALFFSELRKRYKDQLRRQLSLGEGGGGGGDQPSVMAAGGLRPRQLTLISEKSQS